MAQPGVITATFARAAPWKQAHPEIKVLEINTPDGVAPADGSDFLAIQFHASSNRRWAVTDRYYREEGGIRFVLHTERSIGTDRALQLAGELATLYRDREFDGVHTQVPGSPFLDDGNDNGKYFVVAFVVPYYFNYEG